MSPPGASETAQLPGATFDRELEEPASSPAELEEPAVDRELALVSLRLSMRRVSTLFCFSTSTLLSSSRRLPWPEPP